jgi:tRNA threonylcarbamoyladenosine biosynthesis protein TsaE
MKKFTHTPNPKKSKLRKHISKSDKTPQKKHTHKNLVCGLITTSNKQTQKLGEMLANELKGGKIICLFGDLGTGKTTFTQGLLKGLKIKGLYTSPTFVILKKYASPKVKSQKSKSIYHIDAYRIKDKDLLDLGWKEIIKDKNNIVIIEWAERVKKIIPKNAIWIKFKWIDENKRELKLT